MRVAFVIPRLVRHAGGTEQATAALIAQVAQRHEVTIFSGAVCGLEGVPYCFRRVACFRRPVVLEYVSFLVCCGVLRWWLRVVHGVCFDVVHSPGVNAISADVISAHWCQAAALAQGRSLALNGGSLIRWLRRVTRGIHGAVVMRSERWVYPRRAVRQVVCVSLRVQGEIAHFYGRENARMICIPNGVDVERFHPQHRCVQGRWARAALGIGEDELVVATVGGDWERKGVGTLLEAFAGLSGDPWLLVVGQGDVAQYRAHAAAMGCAERVIFLGVCVDVVPFYAAADVYVSPTRYEPFGLTLLEALASGVATVVSRCAGVSAWLRHGDDVWLLDDPQNVAEVRDALTMLLDDADLRRRLGEAGRRVAEQFSWERVGLAYEEVYACVRGG